MLPKQMFAIALGLAALAGCGREDAQATATHIAVLDKDNEPLRDDFNRGQGNVRLLFLVDPRCPGCLRGLADMGDDLLSSLPKSAHVKVYVVHEPVIGGGAKDIPAAAELLRTSIARHYWNPAGDFGREMSHALGFFNRGRWVYAWDTWMIYPPDAVWSGATPPPPAFLMHQLAGLEGDARFPFLDGKVFAAKVRAMLKTQTRTDAAR